jgi:dipeptidase
MFKTIKLITTAVVILAVLSAGFMFGAAGNAAAGPEKRVLNPTRVRDKCSTIMVGKGVTADRSMLIAHNEDLGNYSAHHYIYVPHAIHKSGETVSTYYGAAVPQVSETCAYTATTIFDINYVPGDVTSGINEHLVAVVNNASYRRDAPDPLPTAGRLIWTEFTKFALERAATAAEAVEVIGSLASSYKLGADSGTIFGVIDPNEGWWVEVTLEGQWVAQKMQNNTASGRANIFRIGVVDFNDTETFKYSDDLVSYAQNQGWYVSGDFDFSAVYAEPTKVTSQYNLRRTWRIGELLKDSVAAKTVDPQLIMGILRDHYEGTDYDLTAGYMQGSPHQTDERTLCRLDTEVSTVIQARTRKGRQDLPAEIGGIAWRAVGTPCSSIYTPWYLGSLKVPEEYQTGNSQFTQRSAYWTARNLSKTVDMRYRTEVVDEIRSDRGRFERKEFDDQTEVENVALRLYRQNPDKARAYLSEYSTGLAQKAMEELRSLTRFSRVVDYQRSDWRRRRHSR